MSLLLLFAIDSVKPRVPIAKGVAVVYGECALLRAAAVYSSSLSLTAITEFFFNLILFSKVLKNVSFVVPANTVLE